MCGKKDKDEEEELASMEDEVEEKSCARPARIMLLILNFIIWLGSCALLALGIYAIVDSPFTREVLDGNTVMVIAIVLIGVGSVAFVISFIGCCGAMFRNKCLVMTYVIVLVLLLAILLIGGILAFFFRNRLQTAGAEAMRKSMQKYKRNEPNTPVNRAWDLMQRQLQCCGISGHQNWQVFNPDYNGQAKIPESCCVIDQNTQTIRSGCTNGVNVRDFFNNAGCQDRVIQLLDEKSPYVAIVGAIVAFCMVFGAILGIVAYNRW